MIKTFFYLALLLPFLFACSAEKKLANRVVGSEWRISNFEIDDGRPRRERTQAQNIGTIQFNENFTGVKNIRLNVMGQNTTDDRPFTWQNTGQSISIRGAGSYFAKTWIVLKNRKNFQQWQSSEGNDGIKIMELRR
ncbi:MAG: hypothetical protein JJT94_06395 [Bernardetiaceae bacterium]|nr:hypothetical protein [Bernardetiaceae bacterium]